MLKALPLAARALVSRSSRRAATTQAAALASRSFHVSAPAFAPKEITVRDAINGALVSRIAERALVSLATPPALAPGGLSSGFASVRRCMHACMRMRAWS
jgi:hypothetical protein